MLINIIKAWFLYLFLVLVGFSLLDRFIEFGFYFLLFLRAQLFQNLDILLFLHNDLLVFLDKTSLLLLKILFKGVHILLILHIHLLNFLCIHFF